LFLAVFVNEVSEMRQAGGSCPEIQAFQQPRLRSGSVEKSGDSNNKRWGAWIITASKRHYKIDRLKKALIRSTQCTTVKKIGSTNCQDTFAPQA
jgi:hypothetical protein